MSRTSCWILGGYSLGALSSGAPARASPLRPLLHLISRTAQTRGTCCLAPHQHGRQPGPGGGPDGGGGRSSSGLAPWSQTRVLGCGVQADEGAPGLPQFFPESQKPAHGLAGALVSGWTHYRPAGAGRGPERVRSRIAAPTLGPSGGSTPTRRRKPYHGLGAAGETEARGGAGTCARSSGATPSTLSRPRG